MSKFNSYKRQRMIKTLKGTLLHHAGSTGKQVDVFSKEFLDILRNRIFNSESERKRAFETFMHLINCYKDLKNAVYVTYTGPSTFESIPLEQSIARGSQHPYSKEFLYNDEIYPTWYLQSRVRSDEKNSS